MAILDLWETLFWSIVTVLLGFVFLWAPSDLCVITSVSIMALGGRIFWAHGGHQITGAGLYGLASAVFAGFAGIYWAFADVRVAQQLTIVLVWSFLSLLAMHLLIWKPRQPTFPVIAEQYSGNLTLPLSLAVVVSGCLIAISSVAGTESLVHITAGAMVFWISALMLSGRDGTRFLRSFAAAGVVILFWLTIFTVFGRLVLVSLVLTAVVIYSGFRSSKSTKMVVILASPVALLGLVTLRSQEMTRTGVSYDGLGSVVNPLRDLGYLSDAIGEGSLLPANGEYVRGHFPVLGPAFVVAGEATGFRC